MLYKETSYIEDEPGVAGCCTIGKWCDKDQIGQTLNSYSAWKKCNMNIPLGERGIRILFERDE